ncbi:MAG: GGDEF domain-containing protein [Roseburia sp.]|nr:GGDEF domain-containing protein [Roseburia sp.]MCM1278669.1 GGDEF domain-containing protein [Robinsoniella sp.]
MEKKGFEKEKMLQKVQDKFCFLGDFYACCVDGSGNQLTEWSGKEEDLVQLKKAVSSERLYNLFERVKESPLEEQMIEETDYCNLKAAAIGYKMEGKLIFCWLACCVFAEEETNGLPVIRNIQRITTEERIYETAKLLRKHAEQIFVSGNFQQAAVEEHAKKTSFQRMSHYTEALQLLECNQPFEEAAGKLLRLMGKALQINSAGLVKVLKDERSVDVVCEWLKEGTASRYDRVRKLERHQVFHKDEPVVISADSIISKEIKEYMEQSSQKAFISIPLALDGKPAMYLYLSEEDRERIWQLEEIQFIKDMARIMQSLLVGNKRENSMAASFSLLQSVVDNVGSCVYVQDVESGKIIFTNKQLKSTFELELQNGKLMEMVQQGRPVGLREGYYEIHYNEKNRWYDLYFSYITWMDGNRVSLYVLHDITDKKIYQKRIEQQAYTDFLTGLYNRMCCERDLSVQLDKASAEGKTGGLLYLDLDDFKHINDGLGHQYGDVLLKSISNSLRRIKGISNSCYRMGGDEFVIIIPPESFDSFDEIIQDIQAIFSKPWFLKDADYYCTMSMGIVNYPDDGNSVQDLIKKADIAMYDAKKAGKNRCTRYSQKLSMASNKRLDMEKSMRDATANNYQEFEVYYQPIIDVLSGEPVCTGAEALIRWNSATMGFVPPSEFIPLAEYLGLINPIGNYVLREACIACRGWNDRGMGNFKVNVNLSVIQLLQPDIVEIVENTIKETGINPINLTLEVTESLAINDMERMKKILSRIRSLGVRIALDDFGTGYSSLNHIREIPLDVIKVDQNFVQGLAEDSYSQSFIKMVAELAAAINVNVCVEGIETEEQFRVVNDMKIQLIQGYYFDRPLQLPAFETKYVMRNE